MFVDITIPKAIHTGSTRISKLYWKMSLKTKFPEGIEVPNCIFCLMDEWSGRTKECGVRNPVSNTNQSMIYLKNNRLLFFLTEL